MVIDLQGRLVFISDDNDAPSLKKYVSDLITNFGQEVRPEEVDEILKRLNLIHEYVKLSNPNSVVFVPFFLMLYSGMYFFSDDDKESLEKNGPAFGAFATASIKIFRASYSAADGEAIHPFDVLKGLISTAPQSTKTH